MHLYQPDPELPGIDCLLGPSALLDQVQPWYAENAIQSLSVESIRYKPGTSCLVGYQVELADGRRELLHAKAFRVDEWPVRRKKWQDAGEQVLLIERQAIAVSRFPHDQQLPAIKVFHSDPAGFLKRVLVSKRADCSVADWQILAYKPNRRFVARIELVSGPVLVLKIFDQVEFQKSVLSAAFLKKNLVSGLPNRIGRSSRHRAIAYSWIHGRRLDLGNLPAAEASAWMHRILDYLQRLHTPRLTKHSRLPIHAPGEGIAGMASYLASICPPLSMQSKRISDRILGHVATDHELSLIHGDFHEGQLLVDGENLQACDFDNCGLGDPLSDAANLIAHLQLRALMGQIPTQLVQELEALAVNRIATNTGIRNRYQWQNAASLFRLASHPFRDAMDDWVSVVQELLEIVDRRLTAISNRNAVFIPVITPDESGGFSQRTTSPVLQESRQKPEFEVDAAFDYLRSALDPRRATRILQEDVPGIARRWGNYVVEQTICLRHKAGRRCLLEFQLSTDQGLVSIVGKSSVRRLDRRTFRVQRKLRSQFGFRKTDESEQLAVFVPLPLGCCPRWKMWFQEFVFGTTGEGVPDELTGRPGGFCGVADAIAKLHRSEFRPQRQHQISDEMAILSSRLHEAAAEIPHHTQGISRVLRNCERIAEVVNESEPRPLHRDFYHDQLILSDRDICLVDWDLACMGNPALDAGNFCAHLIEYGIRKHGDPFALKEQQQEFVNRYLLNMPDVPRQDIEAFTTLSLARHISIASRIRSRREILDTLIPFVVELSSHQFGGQTLTSR